MVFRCDFFCRDQFLIELENQSKTCLLYRYIVFCSVSFSLSHRERVCVCVFSNFHSGNAHWVCSTSIKIRNVLPHQHQHHHHDRRYWSSFSPPSKKNGITKVHSQCCRNTRASLNLFTLSPSLNFRCFFLYGLWFNFRLFSCARSLYYTQNYHRWSCVYIRSLVILFFDAMLFRAIKMSIECLALEPTITERGKKRTSEKRRNEVTRLTSRFLLNYNFYSWSTYYMHPHLVVPHSRQISLSLPFFLCFRLAAAFQSCSQEKIPKHTHKKRTTAKYNETECNEV